MSSSVAAAATGPDLVTIPPDILETTRVWRQLEVQRLQVAQEAKQRIEVLKRTLAAYLKTSGIDSIKGVCYLSRKQRKPALTWDLIAQVWGTLITAQGDDGSARRDMEALRQSFDAHLRAAQNHIAVTDETVELYRLPKPKRNAAGDAGTAAAATAASASKRARRRVVAPVLPLGGNPPTAAGDDGSL